MSYDFEKNNSNYGHAETTVITGYPFTIGCWFKAESIADGDTIIALGQNADPNPFTALRFDSSSKIYGWRRVFSGNITNNATLTPNVTISTGTWYWVAFVVSGRYSHRVWVNGTASTEFVTDMEDWTTNNNLDRIGLAALVRSGVQDYFDGKVAEYAIWKSALVQADMDSLAGGAPANTVGSNLWGWWRMNSDQGTSLTDSATGNSITVSASGLYSADHPTISAGSTTKPAYYYAQL